MSWKQFVAESLDVIEDPDWVISLGNSFAKQYELYSSEDEHSALLHRYDALFLPYFLPHVPISGRNTVSYIQISCTTR